MLKRLRTYFVAALVGMLATQGTAAPSHDKIKDLAAQAYLYGLQQVIFFGQRWIYTQNDHTDNGSYVGINRFNFVRDKITPDFPIVTPNSTTLYGNGFIDLTEGPVIIEMPEITDRYFSLQIMDQYGIFYMMVGNQFNGTDAQNYVITPPGYTGDLPEGFPTTNVIPATSKTGFLFIRMAVLTGDEKDIATINGYQDAVTLTPMADWVANGRKGVARSDQSVVAGTYPTYHRMPDIAQGQVDKQTAEDFFTILNVVLNDPTMTRFADSKMEDDYLAQLGDIGIGVGQEFSWNSLDPEVQVALDEGFKAGFKNVRDTLQSNLINMNGWMEVRNAGGFQTGWLDRAVMADAGWAGPDRNVSHTGAFRFDDSDGNPLNGENKYTITFDTQNLPPVTQFWSIPIYNADGYFVDNDINRYTVNSFMLDNDEFTVSDDNKLVFYVQTEKPEDADQAKNWLPSPDGNFRFTARFYGPEMAIIDGSYPMPAPVKVTQ